MLLIRTSVITPRLRYAFSLLLREILGMDFEITTREEEFMTFQGPRLSYLREPVPGSLYIRPADILFEDGIRPVHITSSVHEGLPVLFPTSDEGAALPYDPFAAAFYMVSRYEEYSLEKADPLGRFPAENSIAFRENFLGMPVVHHWAARLGSVLKSRFPVEVSAARSYRFVPTIDIDHAYAFLGRGWTRTLGGYGRSLLKGDLREIGLRTRVLCGNAKDPYDNYDWIREIHDAHDLHPLFFILCADWGGDDNNVPPGDSRFRQMLRVLDSDGRVGIHPSLASHKDARKRDKEFLEMTAILGREPLLSRMHFLKIGFPGTYRDMIRRGITDDYSMGYASHPGFRAGIAQPFLFFDLERNEVTGLRIHPFAVMDVTLRDYLRLNARESLEIILKMIHQVRSVSGELVTLWHNESLSESGRWKGWREVYETLLTRASSETNHDQVPQA